MKIHEIDADKNYIFIFRGMPKVDAQYIEYSINKWLRDSGKIHLMGLLTPKDAELVDIVEMEGTPKSIHISQQVDICEADDVRKAYVGPRPFRVDLVSLNRHVISFRIGEHHGQYVLPSLENNSWMFGLVYWMNKQWQKIVFKQ